MLVAATLDAVSNLPQRTDVAADDVCVGSLTEGGPDPRLAPSALPPASGDAVRPVLCHYCELLPGTTVDHIVPRSLLPRAERMLGMVTANSVKACSPCNNRKGHLRVDCCATCLAAWQRWGPPDWETSVTVVSKIWVSKKARTLARQ